MCVGPRRVRVLIHEFFFQELGAGDRAAVGRRRPTVNSQPDASSHRGGAVVDVDIMLGGNPNKHSDSHV